jgi:hypothetical protein
VSTSRQSAAWADPVYMKAYGPSRAWCYRLYDKHGWLVSLGNGVSKDEARDILTEFAMYGRVRGEP